MDKYDTHIAELNSFSGEEQLRKIASDWLEAKGIFQFLCKVGFTNGSPEWTRRPSNIGCPTMIKASNVEGSYYKYKAESLGLTEAIINDERIPLETQLIRPVHFEIFAALQRQADQELGRF